MLINNKIIKTNNLNFFNFLKKKADKNMIANNIVLIGKNQLGLKLIISLNIIKNKV